MNKPFQLVDVFSHGPLTGNPLAVVLEADDLSTAAMQSITRWLNYSETTFLLTPTAAGADYRVRIFTLEREMPFAGHPTLGSCHAWLHHGGRPAHASEIIQECGAGLIPIRREPKRLSFAAPPLIRGGTVEEAKLAEVAAFLRVDRARFVDAQWADNGPGWIAVLFDSAAEVLALEPARESPVRMDIGVVGPHPEGKDAAFELRAFFTDQHGTVREDPVTGSLNASVAQWLLCSRRAAAPYTASQGTRLGRVGRIYITQDSQGVWVGGNTQTHFSGAYVGESP